MSSNNYNKYWVAIPDISRKVIVSEIQYYLGPEATVRPYAREGEDGFLITTPGDCLTDEQIDDICRKSREVWEKQAAARTAKKESDAKQLKRPLNQPVLIQPKDSGGGGGSGSASSGGSGRRREKDSEGRRRR